MAASVDENIRAGAAELLAPGEQVLVTLVASVRGHQQAMAGGVGGMVGGQRQAKARGDAGALGVKLSSPMAFVLTSARVLTFKTGGRGRTEGLLNDFAFSDVGSMHVKRLGLGAAVTLTVHGATVKLESRVGAARAFAAELERMKNGCTPSPSPGSSWISACAGHLLEIRASRSEDDDVRVLALHGCSAAGTRGGKPPDPRRRSDSGTAACAVPASRLGSETRVF